MINKKLIVARYNENISWTRQVDFADVIIYNKGADEIPGAILLPNVGRESGTYLRFIIDNYDSLEKDDLYFFLQGSPFEHYMSFEDLKGCNGPQYFGRKFIEVSEGITSPYFPIGFPGKKFCDMFFLENPFPSENQYVPVIYGANFCASGEMIKKRCKEFYQFLDIYAQTLNPIEGHIMERIWVYILFTDIKDKITEYSKSRKAFTRNATWGGMKID